MVSLLWGSLLWRTSSCAAFGGLSDRFERSAILGWFVSCSVPCGGICGCILHCWPILDSPTGYLGLKGGGGRVIDIVLLLLSLGLGLLASRFDLSLALGAFVAGATISQTQLVQDIEKRMTPVRQLSGAVFFMSVGMWVDPLALIAGGNPFSDFR